MLANGVNQEQMQHYIVPKLFEKMNELVDQRINTMAEVAIRRAALESR
jgi:hypothetical protein